MLRSTTFLSALVFLSITLLLHAQDRPSQLPHRTVTLRKPGASLEEALAAIKDQTGIAVLDRRSAKKPAHVDLSFDRATFWQGLDVLARQADAQVSLHQEGGQIAMVNGPHRALPTSYEGIFRTTLKRLAAVRNLETATDLCTLEVEATWEPWFRPFLFDAGASEVRYAGPTRRLVVVNLPAQGRTRVAGRSAVFELRLPAPPRAVAKLDSVKGTFKIIGPTKMLAFRFENLKPGVARQEGVSVRLARIVRQPDRWSFDMIIDNPPGGPTFESHQAQCWLDHNRIYLQKGAGPSAMIWEHKGDEQADSVTEARAAITYHFPLRGRPPAGIGKPEDWHLGYIAAGPIVEAAAAYSFKDLLLP